jgi:hypothetical protein
VTRPTDSRVLEKFYRATRPFGLWGPLKSRLPAAARAHVAREHRNDLLALPFALAWQITMFMLPMLAIVGNWRAFWPTLAIFLTGLTGMYIFWYRNLPPAEAGVLNDIPKLSA